MHISIRPAGLLAFVALAACSDVQPLDPAGVGGPVDQPQANVQEAVVPGEVIVKLREGVDPARAGMRLGVTVADRGDVSSFSVMRADVGRERETAARLAQDPDVEYAEPNYLRQPHAIDARLWAFFNPGGLNMKFSSGGSKGQPLPASYASLSDADMDNIEGIGAGGSAVVVGSIDTGVQLNHPQLVGRTIAGRDWYNNDADPSDSDNHGTHTAGTMAGSTVGVAGVAGAAANVKVHVQRVCGRNGCPTSAIANAIRAAADVPNLVAMNVSIGGGSLSQAERDAIAYATGKNVLVIASAGNSNVSTVDCPACDPNAISVSATDWKDARASYSSWGSGLDISAPGGNCYSNTTAEGCIYSSVRNSGYGWMQGTSMAAPQVTGTAGVVASKTGLRGAALRARLEGTADDKGPGGYDTTFGNGRLNAYRAITNSNPPAGI
jgi:subtilisin family serine protease